MSIKFKGLKLNEEVTIPPELANAYLSVKKQIVDKQTKKDNLMKSVNQVDNEINVLTKNLIAIETKAASSEGEQEKQNQKVAQQQKDLQSAAVTGGVANESLDEKWAKLIESMWDEQTDVDIFADEDEEVEDASHPHEDVAQGDRCGS
jgi:septal ring factor EnvC (AmiA/AmiB activator)